METEYNQMHAMSQLILQCGMETEYNKMHAMSQKMCNALKYQYCHKVRLFNLGYNTLQNTVLLHFYRDYFEAFLKKRRFCRHSYNDLK